MHALVKAACGVALLAALGTPEPTAVGATPTGPPSQQPTATASATAEAPPASPQPPGRRCAPGSISLRQASGPSHCLPLPSRTRATATGARQRRLATLPPAPAFLRTTAPREMVPRLPERPERYTSYQLPIDPFHGVTVPLEALQPGGARADLGVELNGESGAAVTLIDLEGQQGRAEVALVGQLHGITVVVRHRVPSREGEREYLAFYGNLGRPGPQIVNGAQLGPMSVIGYLADEEEVDEAYLYFEIRQLRTALSRPMVHLSQLVTASVAIDPRNVLPVRP